MLVVQPHAHLAVGALRNLGNRRRVHLLAGHDAQPGQEHPRDADHAVLALALYQRKTLDSISYGSGITWARVAAIIYFGVATCHGRPAYGS
jgi:hypothetical protein